VSSGDIEEACGRAEQHLTTRFLWLDRRVGPSGPAASGLWGR